MAENVDEFFKQLPPGIRFLPTDEEVISCLEKKILNIPMPKIRIRTFHVYTCHPNQLPRDPNLMEEENCYFFTKREKKYLNGSQPDRTAGNGYWKATGKAFPVRNKGGEEIGEKRTLVYHEGEPKDSVKTDWIMKEYRLIIQNNGSSTSTTAFTKTSGANNNTLDECVLVKIYDNKKSNKSSSQEKETTILDSEQLPPAEEEAEDQENMILKLEQSPIEDENTDQYIKNPEVPNPQEALEICPLNQVPSTDNYNNKEFSYHIEDGFWNTQHSGLNDWYGFSEASSSGSGLLQDIVREGQILQRKRKMDQPNMTTDNINILGASCLQQPVGSSPQLIVQLKQA